MYYIFYQRIIFLSILNDTNNKQTYENRCNPEKKQNELQFYSVDDAVLFIEKLLLILLSLTILTTKNTAKKHKR